MSNKNFNEWLFCKPDWKEIAFEYNTGRNYQHKQELVAVFGNVYVYHREKIETYFKKFNELPIGDLKNLILDFRQHFPKTGRVEGINYFDDLVELLIERYNLLRQAQMGKSKILDTDFIQGRREEGFKTIVNAESKKVEHWFVVTKKNETREYTPLQFINLVLECHYIAADKTFSLDEELSAFVNAESVIKRYIRENNLNELGYDFSKIFEDLNDQIKKISEYKKLEIVKPDNLSNTKLQLEGYTNSQLVLIFYYFFKQNGLEPRVNIDIAPIAKFLHFITGKKFKSVQASDFYQKLRNAPNFKTDKELINDLEVIKLNFEKVQLNEIVKMLDNEIGMARNETKQNRKGKKI